MQWLTPTALTALASAIGTLLMALQAIGHRSRKRIRALVAQADAWEEFGYGVRSDARRHNHSLPDGVEPFTVRPFPAHMEGVAKDDDATK